MVTIIIRFARLLWATEPSWPGLKRKVFSIQGTSFRSGDTFILALWLWHTLSWFDISFCLFSNYSSKRVKCVFYRYETIMESPRASTLALLQFLGHQPSVQVRQSEFFGSCFWFVKSEVKKRIGRRWHCLVQVRNDILMHLHQTCFIDAEMQEKRNKSSHLFH